MQLEALRKRHDDEIKHHEAEIRRHQEAIDRHKSHRKDVHDAEKKAEK
jgi:hypothetical protein